LLMLNKEINGRSDRFTMLFGLVVIAGALECEQGEPCRRGIAAELGRTVRFIETLQPPSAVAFLVTPQKKESQFDGPFGPHGELPGRLSSRSLTLSGSLEPPLKRPCPGHDASVQIGDPAGTAFGKPGGVGRQSGRDDRRVASHDAGCRCRLDTQPAGALVGVDRRVERTGSAGAGNGRRRRRTGRSASRLARAGLFRCVDRRSRQPCGSSPNAA